MGRGGQATRMRSTTQADRDTVERATEREVRVLEAVLVAGSEKAAAHRLGVSYSTVKHHLANANAARRAAPPLHSSSSMMAVAASPGDSSLTGTLRGGRP